MKTTINIECNSMDELATIAALLSGVNLNTTKVEKATPVSKPTVTEATDFDRTALETEAKALGVPFRSNISDKSLSIKIENFKKEHPNKASDTEGDIDKALSEDSDDSEDEDELMQQIQSKKQEVEETDEETEEVEEEPEEDSSGEESEEVEEGEPDEEVQESQDKKEKSKSLKSAFKSRKRKAVTGKKASKGKTLWNKKKR